MEFILLMCNTRGMLDRTSKFTAINCGSIVKVLCQEKFIPARNSSEPLGNMNDLANIFKSKFCHW